MNDSSKKPLFDDEELAGTTPDDDDSSSNETTLPDGSIKKPVVEGTSSTTTPTNDDEPGDQMQGESSELDEGKLQAIADQLASLDDDAMAAAVRGMPDESRQALCSAVAATLSDEQLGQCGLSKGAAMAMDEDEVQLQEDMAVARPEHSAGSISMSLTPAKAKPGENHPHSLELAQMKANDLLNRARAVHAKNSAVITAEQLEGIEAKLQGQRCLSLLKSDNGDLQPITVLVAMGERMVKGDGDADLLEVKTLNMSLTGSDGGQAKPVKVPDQNTNGFNEAEAKKLADERWKSPDKTTPAMHG